MAEESSFHPGSMPGRRPGAFLLVTALAALVLFAPPITAAGPDVIAPKEVRLPPLAWVTPFVVMLLCIALLPLLPHAHHWWESNGAKLGVSATLALVTAG